MTQLGKVRIDYLLVHDGCAFVKINQAQSSRFRMLTDVPCFNWVGCDQRRDYLNGQLAAAQVRVKDL